MARISRQNLFEQVGLPPNEIRANADQLAEHLLRLQERIQQGNGEEAGSRQQRMSRVAEPHVHVPVMRTHAEVNSGPQAMQ